PNLLALEAILEPLGHRLIRASSGEEALRSVLNEEVAVILLDVQMPGMDGFETAAILKSRPRTRHIPIIMITSRTAGKHRNYAMELGVNEYLGKPYQENELLKHIADFVNKTEPVA
ncbi:MAG: response regulator, partial [Burkholderiaceae bacterium]